MTGFSEPHGAVPYAAEVIPPAEVNTIVSNSRTEFRRSLHTWTVLPSPDPTGSNNLFIPLYIPAWSAIIACVSTSAGKPSLYRMRGTSWVAIVSYSGLATGEQLVLCHPDGADYISGFSDNSSDTYYLSEGGEDTGGGLPGGATFDDSDTFTAAGPSLYIPAATANDHVWVVPGRSGTDYPALVVFRGSASAAVINASATASSQFMRRVATDGADLIVAVGGVDTAKTVAVSDDNGDTWTWGAFPALTGAPATAQPSITYDSVRELFVATMLDSVYEINYCSSPDGSSWGDWHQIPGSSAEPDDVDELTADIIAIGGTWIACRAFKSPLAGDGIVQVVASHDGGATWFDISPAASINSLGGLWMVQLGNRVAVCTTTWIAVSEPFDVGPEIASELS